MADHEKHHHHQSGNVADLFTQETWDARYGESDRIWSGRPNARLVEHAEDLEPGDALDVGAGEGGDAVWLAGRGWRVTALDVSPVALARAAAHAAEAGVADRVSTLHHDLMTGAPLPGTYDLVSAQYLHPPRERFAELLGLLGAAVRPGGALLVVGHHPEDPRMKERGGHRHPELLFTADQVVAVLPADIWDIRVADEPAHDTVVLAVRRA
ncbi:MAG: methyltransferase domain-containing protein [Nocardioidaceae bacterium]|nr:methyltransferase domain-containing protein [Nocardioidaceae bacterium]